MVTLQAKSGQIGELSKDAFLTLLSTRGYTTSNTSEQFLAKLSDGSTSVHIVFGFGVGQNLGENHVASATGRVEFATPRFLENKKLLDWLAREKLERVKVRSFLSGRVVLEAQIAYPSSTTNEVKANVENLLGAILFLKRELAPLGGRQSERLYEVGKAPLDLDAKLVVVEPEDLDYLREQFRWGNRVSAGVIRGWITGAEPLGVPVYFTGMAGSRPGFSMTCMGSPDAKKLERWTKLGAPITWAEVVVQEGFVHIQKGLDTSGGFTVREVRDQIQDFARRVKALDLF